MDFFDGFKISLKFAFSNNHIKFCQTAFFATFNAKSGPTSSKKLETYFINVSRNPILHSSLVWEAKFCQKGQNRCKLHYNWCSSILYSVHSPLLEVGYARIQHVHALLLVAPGLHAHVSLPSLLHALNVHVWHAWIWYFLVSEKNGIAATMTHSDFADFEDRIFKSLIFDA